MDNWYHLRMLSEDTLSSILFHARQNDDLQYVTKNRMQLNGVNQQKFNIALSNSKVSGGFL